MSAADRQAVNRYVEDAGRWRRVLLATGLGVWIVNATQSTMNVAFGEIQRDFDYSTATIGWIVTAYAIVFGALMVPAGRIADRYGRRRTFQAGLALFVTGSLVCFISANLAMLIVGRAVQAIAGAIVLPASLGLLLQVTAPERRVRAVTLWSAANTVGGASGPTLGALVVDWQGWRSSFALTGAGAILIMAFGRRDLPDDEPVDEEHPLDYLGIVLVAVSMAALTLGVSQGNAWGWLSVGVGVAIGGAVATGVAVVLRSLHRPAPALPVDLFANPRFSLANVASMLFGLLGGCQQLVNILFLRNVMHYSIAAAGAGVVFAPIFASLTTPITAKLGARFGERTIALPGLALMSLNLVWLAHFTQDTGNQYWIDFFPAAVINGIGVGLTFPMINAAGVRVAGQANLSLVSGTIRTSSQLGQAIGLAAIFIVLGDRPSTAAPFHRGWLLMLVSTGATALCMALLKPSRDRAR